MKTIILALEEELLRAEVRQSARKIQNIIAEDFMEITSSGRVYNYKAGDLFMDPLEGEEIDWEVIGFAIKNISKDIVMANYGLIKHGLVREGVYSLRTSLWRNEAGSWKMFFHQGTRTNRFIEGDPSSKKLINKKHI